MSLALKVEAFKREIQQIPVDIEEWLREKQVVDSLYKRVYYARHGSDYNRLKFEVFNRKFGSLVMFAIKTTKSSI